jgi:hypothetical protein
MNREDGFSVVRSRKPLIHNIKERKKVLWRDNQHYLSFCLWPSQEPLYHTAFCPQFTLTHSKSHLFWMPNPMVLSIAWCTLSPILFI